jgi:hypothetical protein
MARVEQVAFVLCPRPLANGAHTDKINTWYTSQRKSLRDSFSRCATTAWARVRAASTRIGGVEELPGTSSRQQHVLRPLISRSAKPRASVGQDELAYAVAEIERASKDLQASEALSVRRPSGWREGMHGCQYRSIWLMIAIIWISSALVLVIGSAAILYLMR